MLRSAACVCVFILLSFCVFMPVGEWVVLFHNSNLLQFHLNL